VVVSADTVDLVRFPLLFLASVIWAAAWEVGILHAVCRVRRGAATLDEALRDVAVRTMCGSRTGGLSLLCVMSD
jgi:hypothetical protein